MRSRAMTVLMCVAVALLAGPLDQSRAADRSTANERTLRQVVRGLAVRSPANDDQYFAGGVWRSGDEKCWRCNVGPGVAAAVLWRHDTWRRAYTRKLALSTFDRMIAVHREADGSFGPPNSNENANDITTMFAALELGVAYDQMKPTLGADRKRRWRRALAGAADFLRGKVLDFYINGNINLGATLVFQSAWKATGAERFKQAYDASWDFTTRPPAPRWEGRGLIVAQQAQRADQSDGKGYLAEDGGDGPGYDPEYTMLQTSMLARAYALYRDRRALRLLNLLTNQLLLRVDPESKLDTSGGTRHVPQGRKVPLLTGAPSVLAKLGGRRDLSRSASRHAAALRRELVGSLAYSHGNLYRSLGLDGSTLVLAERQRASVPEGVISVHRLISAWEALARPDFRSNALPTRGP